MTSHAGKKKKKGAKKADVDSIFAALEEHAAENGDAAPAPLANGGAQGCTMAVRSRCRRCRHEQQHGGREAATLV